MGETKKQRSPLTTLCYIEKDDSYLLLQNIRNEGWYKEALGYGLLVWRIDYDGLPSVNLGDNPNNTTGKPRVMIVPADGMVYNSYNRTVSDNDIITSLQNDPFPTYKAVSIQSTASGNNRLIMTTSLSP